MRVVLDTNVWVSGLLWGGSPRRVIELAEQQQLTVFVSDRLLRELETTLKYPKLQARITKIGIPIEELLLKVRQLVELCAAPPLLAVPNLRDPDDAIVVAIAVAISADAIVTGDDDLLVLEQFDRIPILTPAAFIEQYFSG